MPQPSGERQGIRQTQSRRVGIDLSRFKGMNRHSDPGAIGEEEFWDLINVRLGGDGISSRPGLSEINSNAMSGCVYGLWDDRNPDDEGNAIFNAVKLGYGPQVWTDINDASEEPGLVVGKFNGNPIAIDNAGQAYGFSYTTTAGVAAFTSTAIFTYSSSLTDATIRSIVQQGDTLWFVYAEPITGDVEVWKWTGGATASLDHTVAMLDTWATLGANGSDIYLAGKQQILKRDNGAWTSLSMPGGITNWLPVGYRGFERLPYLFFSGVDADVANPDQMLVILQVLETTVSIANDAVPTYSGTNNNYGELAAIGGYLYVIGNTTQGVDSLSLYQISGGNSATAIANLTSQIGAVSGDDDFLLLQLRSWRNQLFCSVPISSSSATLAKATIADPTTWSVVTGATDTPVLANGTSLGSGSLFTA